MPTKPSTHRPGVVLGVRLRGPRRPSASALGYGHRWRKLRAQVLARQPLCVHCLAQGRIVPATQVDHIVPRSAGGSDEDSNLQSLCAACHSRKTATEDRTV